MKLLFKDDAQFNDLLGFVDADLEIGKMKSELFTATKDLISLIGKEAYSYALGLALKEEQSAEEGSAVEFSDEEADSLYNFRYPIAVDAYRHYAPSGDLSHTNNGRKMRNDEYEKSAFEWMINRDNEALEKRYYKALDNLLDHLDDTDPVLVAAGEGTAELKWTGTEAYQKTHRLFVRKTSDFDPYHPINSRLLLLKLQPGLSRCERFEILPRIGAEKFEQYKQQLNGTAPADSDELDESLLNLIKAACVYYAMDYALKRLRVQLFPDGVLQRYAGERVNTINTKVPERLEAEIAAQAFAADAEKELRAIEEYLKPAPTEAEITEGDVIPKVSGCSDDAFFSS